MLTWPPMKFSHHERDLYFLCIPQILIVFELIVKKNGAKRDELGTATFLITKKIGLAAVCRVNDIPKINRHQYRVAAKTGLEPVTFPSAILGYSTN